MERSPDGAGARAEEDVEDLREEPMVVSSRCLLMIGADQCSTPAAHRQQIGVAHRRLIGVAHLRDVGSTHTQRRAPIPGGPATVPAASP